MGCCDARAGLPSRWALALGAVVTDGHREKLAKLFGLHGVGHVLKRSALG